MTITPNAEVNHLVAEIQTSLRELLGETLVGIYIFGSLASESFDPGVSDVDLLVVTSTHLIEADYAKLQQMHAVLVSKFKQWDDRIEVAYLSRDALKTFREKTSTIGIVSPGEPFHRVAAGSEWLMNWYDVRENAIIVSGPDPKTLIDPISHSELNACIHEYTKLFPERLRHNLRRGSDAYAVLTMCRSLYTKLMGTPTTKKRAAQWATSQYPQWRHLFTDAQKWRLAADNEATNSPEVHAQVEAFVSFTIRILSGELSEDGAARE
jgi:predicted nucleotidyltransferase